jgi:glycosyltransferase involved in cell wall biosynthesis
MTTRVLHVVESLAPDAGSVAVTLPGLFDTLRGCGIESRVLTFEGTVACTGVGGNGDLRASEPLTASGDAARVVREANVIHLHGWSHALARHAAAAARKVGVPYVVSPSGALGNTVHDEQSWRDRLRRWLKDKRLIRRARVVTAVHELEERELRAGHVHREIVRLPYGVRVDDYEVRNDAAGSAKQATARSPNEAGTDSTHASVEEGVRAEAGGLPAGRILLILAPIHPAEGYVPLLKAFSELGPAADGWNVVIAGREVRQWRKMLEAAIRRKGGADRVLFTNTPDVVSQRAWLNRASVLAAPSVRTRCPVAVMQAVASGVPVLATTCVTPTGLEDVIRVCAPTRGDLKAGLRFLLELSDEERAAWARRARDVGRKVCDWSSLVDRYARLYQRVA